MGVNADHYANRSTARQVDKPRKQQKQRHRTHTHKRTAEYQLLDSLDDETDVPIQNTKPKRNRQLGTGKAFTDNAEIKQSDQPMATTNCGPFRQFPPCQGVKPRISKRRCNAPNRYRAGDMIAAITQADDWNKIMQELLAKTAKFQKPRER